VAGEDPVHRPYRAQVGALIEELAVDVGGWKVDEALFVESFEDFAALVVGQGAWAASSALGSEALAVTRAVIGCARQPVAVSTLLAQRGRGGSTACPPLSTRDFGPTTHFRPSRSSVHTSVFKTSRATPLPPNPASTSERTLAFARLGRRAMSWNFLGRRDKSLLYRSRCRGLLGHCP